MEQNISINRDRNLFSRRNVVGAFIAAHGAMHAFLLSTPRPEGGAGNFLTRGGDVPLLNSLGLNAASADLIGSALVLIAAAGLMVGALLYLKGTGSAWRAVLSASAALSIITLLTLWNDWMIMGPIISLGILVFVHRSATSPLEA